MVDTDTAGRRELLEAKRAGVRLGAAIALAIRGSGEDYLPDGAWWLRELYAVYDDDTVDEAGAALVAATKAAWYRALDHAAALPAESVRAALAEFVRLERSGPGHERVDELRQALERSGEALAAATAIARTIPWWGAEEPLPAPDVAVAGAAGTPR
jgi:hypothetical protein